MKWGDGLREARYRRARWTRAASRPWSLRAWLCGLAGCPDRVSAAASATSTEIKMRTRARAKNAAN